MSDDFPSRNLDKVVVRLPDGMRDQLKLAAELNRRSVNAEIVARLAESFLFEGQIWPTSHSDAAAARKTLMNQAYAIHDLAKALTAQNEESERRIEKLEARLSELGEISK